MSTLSNRLRESVKKVEDSQVKFVSDAKILNKIVNSDENTTVKDSNGESVSSIKKVIKEKIVVPANEAITGIKNVQETATQSAKTATKNLEEIENIKQEIDTSVTNVKDDATTAEKCKTDAGKSASTAKENLEKIEALKQKIDTSATNVKDDATTAEKCKTDAGKSAYTAKATLEKIESLKQKIDTSTTNVENAKNTAKQYKTDAENSANTAKDNLEKIQILQQEIEATSETMAIDVNEEKTIIYNNIGEEIYIIYGTVPSYEYSDNADVYRVTSYAKLVESYSFKGCRNLSEINFACLEEIGSKAFHGCQHIKSINLPRLIKINQAGFGYTNLSSVSFPFVNYVGSHTFYHCRSLNSVSLPLVNYIGSYTFQYCGNLRNIYINCKAESFQNLAFGVDGKRTQNLIIHTNAEVIDTYTPKELTRIGTPNAIVKEWIQ